MKVTSFRDIIKEEVVDEFVREELVDSLKYAEENRDQALTNALHTVIAYYSVPGTYREGSYDE